MIHLKITYSPMIHEVVKTADGLLTVVIGGIFIKVGHDLTTINQVASLASYCVGTIASIMAFTYYFIVIKSHLKNSKKNHKR